MLNKKSTIEKINFENSLFVKKFYKTKVPDFYN